MRASASTEAIADLRQVAVTAVEHGGEPGQRFAEGVARYEAGASEGLTLDRALRLAPDPGIEGWWTIERRAGQHDLICAAADRHFATLSVRRQAAEIATSFRRYEPGGWRQDQRFSSVPARHIGTVQEFLFQILKLGPAPAQDTIRGILAARPKPSGGKIIR